MGIRGLTTYVNKCLIHCLEDYELQGTYLVIDGINICYQIYYKYENTTTLCGGDYNRYEEAVINFFDNLLACNVIPLVLLDGAYEFSKMDIILKRYRERQDRMLSLTVHQRDEKVPPLHLLNVFKQALRKKNIRHAQCLFEADNIIAAVAKILKCPVLSFDSDFYIYGTFYIPFNTLSSQVVRNSHNKKVIRCKLFNHKYLLSSFKGLNHHTLSLAAVLLGDEKINPKMLKNVIHKIRPSHISARNNYINIIKDTLKWLSEHTVEEAIIEILSGIPKSMRQQVLDIIESTINDYTYINVPATVLVTLSIPEYTMDSTTIFKYKNNIKNIKFTGIYNEHHFETIGNNEIELNKIKNMLIEHRTLYNGNNSIVDKLPTWFVDEMSTATLSSTLMDMVDKHADMFALQVEDVKRPASSLIALKIIKVIYGLLSSIVDHEKTYMKYIISDKNLDLICNELEGTRTVHLSSLRELSIVKRKDILDDTLGIKNMKCIDELLPEWKLYIACIKYCSDQEKIFKSDKCYALSIILCILYNLCCTKNFSKDKSQAHDCKTENIVIEAYRKIDVENCTSAIKYFSRYSVENKKIYYTRKANMSIVHAFAQFQVSLLFAMDLNALLGFPYEEPLMADLFNGIFLYNLCTELQMLEDIPKRINLMLKDSPTILTMFNILKDEVNSLLK